MSKAGDTLGGAASGAAVGTAILPGWGTAIGAGIGGIAGYLGSDDGPSEEDKRKALLAEQAKQAGAFANNAQAQYYGYGRQGQQALRYYQGQMQGQNSVSSEQLRQGLQQQLATQRAYAASASPQNAAMAARTGALAMGRANTGMAGQQALAGIQERNAAAGQYGNMLTALRGQDANVALNSRQNAMTGYGAQNAGAPAPTWIQQYGPAIVGGLQAYAQSKSDRRAKTKIQDADAEASKALDGLKAYTFEYKNPAVDGMGRHLGVMAQDLERAGLDHTMMDTPGGKIIHGSKLAAANTAMLAALGKRVAKLEGASE